MKRWTRVDQLLIFWLCLFNIVVIYHFYHFRLNNIVLDLTIEALDFPFARLNNNKGIWKLGLAKM